MTRIHPFYILIILCLLTISCMESERQIRGTWVEAGRLKAQQTDPELQIDTIYHLLDGELALAIKSRANSADLPKIYYKFYSRDSAPALAQRIGLEIPLNTFGNISHYLLYGNDSSILSIEHLHQDSFHYHSIWNAKHNKTTYQRIYTSLWGVE